jgi:riboflavin synthase
VFTGIVQDVGRIERLEARGGDVRLVIACHEFDTARLRIGDSIAVQGCCLTAVQIEGRSFAADVSGQGRSRSRLEPSSRPAARPTWAGAALAMRSPCPGVDGVAQVLRITGDARSQRLVIGVPAPLASFIAPRDPLWRWTG